MMTNDDTAVKKESDLAVNEQERLTWSGMAVNSPPQTSRNTTTHQNSKKKDLCEPGSMTSKRKDDSQYNSIEQFAEPSSPRSNHSKLLMQDSARRQEVLSWNHGGRTSQATTVMTCNTAAHQREQSSMKILEGHRNSLFETAAKPFTAVEVNDEVVNKTNQKRTRNKKVTLSCMRPTEPPSNNYENNAPPQGLSRDLTHLVNAFTLTPNNQLNMTERKPALPSQPTAVAKTNSVTSLGRRKTTFLEKVQNKQKVSAMTREI